MKRFGEFVVKFRYAFMGLWVALLVLSLLLLPRVKANYDISSYLPSDMETKKALAVIEDEWGMNSFVNVMVTNIERNDAVKLNSALSKIKGVTLASFEPDDESYYKDGNALIKLTVEGGDFSESAQRVVESVKRKLEKEGYTYYTGGSAVEGSRLQNGIGGEMTLIMLISVAVVVAILLASSRSWFEPIIFLLVIGLAVLINLGTNFFLGEISYITKSVAAILQLALAMDYSIVLLHNFDARFERGESAKEAAANALAESVKPIISSSLTTVAGLVALMFMSFGIGFDIGIVMSKGIAISMLTVFFVMPGLIILFSRPLAFLRHKPLPLGGEKLAAGVIKARFVLPVVLVGIIAAGAVMQSFNSYSFAEHQPSKDRDMIESVFESDSKVIVILPRANGEEDYAKQRELVDRVSLLLNADGEERFSAQTYESTCEEYRSQIGTALFDGMVRPRVDAMFNGTDHSRMIFSLNLSRADDEAFRYVDGVREILDDIFGEGTTFMAGGVMTNYDVSKSFGSDLLVTNLITIISILLIIGLTFRSFSLPAVLVLIIQGAIWIALGINYITGSPIFFMSYLIASAILMGATIDYAILITDRYTAARKSMPRADAVKTALSGSMPTVLTSGLILTIAGFVVGSISSSTAISDIGFLLGKGALAAIVLVLVLLPELLYMLDKPIAKTSFGMKFTDDKKLDTPQIKE